MTRLFLAGLISLVSLNVWAEAAHQPLHTAELYSDLTLATESWSQQTKIYFQDGQVVADEQSLDVNLPYCSLRNLEGPVPTGNQPAGFQVFGVTTELGYSKYVPGFILSSAYLTLVSHQNGSFWDLSCFTDASSYSDLFSSEDLEEILGARVGLDKLKFEAPPQRPGELTYLGLQDLKSRLKISLVESVPLLPAQTDPEMQVWVQIVQGGQVLNNSPTALPYCSFLVMGDEKSVNPEAFSGGKAFDFEDAALVFTKDLQGSQVSARFSKGFIAENVECVAPYGHSIALEDLAQATGSLIQWNYQAPLKP